MLFVDDMLAFYKCHKRSVIELKSLLKEFYWHTGLQMNHEKSKVFISKGCRDKLSIARMLGVSLGALPVKYLGLPLTAIYSKAKHFAPLIDATRKRVDGWMLNVLSFPGRIELINSMLQNLLSYWVSSYKLPRSIVRELESIYTKFLWNSRMCWPKGSSL